MNTTIFFGADLLANKNFIDEFIDKFLPSGISNLRKQLKDESNIDMPPINIMDNLKIGRTEIVIAMDGDTKWKQNFESSSCNSFEQASGIIVSELKKIYLAQ